MHPKTVAPYGTWTSPLTVDALTDTGNVAALVEIVVDRTSSTVYHVEKRPAERGRNTLVNTETGRDITLGDWDVRSGVNGYGGAPTIVHGGILYFSNARDGQVYSLKVDGPDDVPQAITPKNSMHKFADFDAHPINPGLLICLMEDHTGAKTPSEAVNSLCILNTLKKTVHPLESDASFYSSPRFSPDGKHLAWIEWDLPDMPFTGTEIWIADVVETPESYNPFSLQNPRHAAGEHGKISVAYPSWLSADVLLFTSDVSGFENPWIYDCIAGEAKPVLETPIAAPFACLQIPKLGFSASALASADGSKVLFTGTKDGCSVLYLINPSTGSAELLASSYTEIHCMRPLRLNQIIFIGTKADAAPAVVQLTLSTEPVFAPLQPPSTSHGLSPGYISLPQPMLLESRTQQVHVVYYPPTNPEYAAAEGEKPPCLLNVHGGPVAVAPQSYNAMTQFFTTRGWGWLDVNYSGSSGYGRAYRERIRRQWGVVDVEDCIAAARMLSSTPHDLVDPKRIVIRGGSAGGFTVLAVLSMRTDAAVFAAGTSLYGISDLRRLLEDTHKYESRFLDMLISEDPVVLLERSPISHANKIVAPLLILQGEADTAVPKAQAEIIVDSIQKRGGVVEYKLYAGEGHGWKRKDTIQDAVLREFRFYNRTLGITVENEEARTAEDA